jgi:hypothetical protein
MGVLHIILKVGHPKIILTQISEQKIFILIKDYIKNFGWDGPWVVRFQYYVPQHRPPYKMAAVTKNRNFLGCRTQFRKGPTQGPSLPGLV